MTYAEKLKDPRWQKKRLEVLQSDNFTCRLCGDTETTLHVHHLLYPESRNPWDSSVDEMVTLCECCHCLVTKTKHDCYSEYFVDVRKHKAESGISFLIALVNDDRKFYYIIYKYENGEIEIDTVITIRMLELMTSCNDKWKDFIQKWEKLDG